MKKAMKWVCLIILVIILSREGLLLLEDRIIEKKDVAGADVHIDDMNSGSVYMLDIYTSRIDADSMEKTPVSYLVTDFKTPISFFKNNKLISQNMNAFLDGYTEKFYIKVDIYENDYNSDGKCKMEFDIVPNKKNRNISLFVGETKDIEDFLISIYIVKTIIASMLLLAILIALSLGVVKKEIYFLSLGIFLLLSFFYFQIGINWACISLAFIGLNILKRKEKLICFIIILSAGFFIEINVYIIMALIAVKIYDLVKKHSIENTVLLMFSGVLFAIGSFTGIHETHWLRVFYEQMYMIVFAAFILFYAGYYFIVVSRKYYHNVSIDLLRGVSHDFKIPLSVIKLNSEIASEGFSTEAQRNNMQLSTNKAVMDLERMLGSLTTYLSKSNYVDSKFNTSVKETFEKIEKSFKDYDDNITFNVVVDIEDAILPIDPIWFDRMIYNLVDNAFKYSKSAGRVTLEYKKIKRKVIITVTDTGIGMTSDEISKAFIPFYRADKSRSKTGLGLGLSLIKSIVDNLDGNIQIRSEVDVGTNITIEIEGK